jgi:rod shape-determining protein MreB and related proteins
MSGRTPRNIRVVKPLKNGEIADFKVTEKMLHCFIQKAHQRKTLVHPRIVIGVPSEIKQVEQHAVMESAYRAGAAEVYLVEQAIMAAIGAGLPVPKPGGNMVVDIGGDTTDVAVISLSGIVYSRLLRIAGNYMDEAIMNYLKRIQPADRRNRLGVCAAQAANHGDQRPGPHRGYAKDDHPRTTARSGRC